MIMTNRFWLLLCSCFVFLVACTTEPCDNKDCGVGTCNEISGDCLCLRGYQWDADERCTVPWSVTYEGSYQVYDSCIGANPGAQTYSSQLTAQDTTTLLWTNFGNTGMSLPVRHSSSTTLFIDWRRNDTIITATSLIRNDVLSINYILNDITNNRIDTCYAIFTKQ